MRLSKRRGGVGPSPGRGLVRAGLLCLVAAGCATDPPPALLTLIDPERAVIHDSEVVPDSARAALRSYLGKLNDSVWGDVSDPELDRFVGECRGLTAVLNTDALPVDGGSARVMVDVPGIGTTEFRLARVRNDETADETYTGESPGGDLSIVIVRDSVFKGRITTTSTVFNFRSGRFGLIELDPPDTSRSLPTLHLVPPQGQADRRAAAEVSAADEMPTVSREGTIC